MSDGIRVKDKWNSLISDLVVEPTNSTGPLSGTTYIVKDNIATSHGYTTAASKILSNYESPFNATIIDLLSSNGSKLIGNQIWMNLGWDQQIIIRISTKLLIRMIILKFQVDLLVALLRPWLGKCVHSVLELILEDQCGCLQVIVTYLDLNLLMVEFLDGGYTVCTDIGYSGDYR